MITGIVSLQLMQFFMNVGSVSGTFGTMKKIAQIMDTDSEPDGGEPVPEVCADIEFDNVSFAYAGGQDVIKNLSVKIPMGKVTAVIGGTVRENIAYGLDREVSDEELAETARRANCYDCITAKPGGFNEDVGLGGSNFSGGQGQCISIARAMLRNADYIIVMKDGAVEAAGTPDELLKTNEYYRIFVKTL